MPFHANTLLSLVGDLGFFALGTQTVAPNNITPTSHG